MTDEGWKRDETPYIVFACPKCKQYSYVKMIQKTKKCLRCGRQYKVSLIINMGEVVKGMTAAVDLLKLRQKELAIREWGAKSDFRTINDFTIEGKPEKSSSFQVDEAEKNKNLQLDRFERMLKEISSSYKVFPFYVFEMMAEIFNIKSSELKGIIRSYEKKGILTRKNSMYSINN